MADVEGAHHGAERASATPARHFHGKADARPAARAGEPRVPRGLRAVEEWLVEAISGEVAAGDAVAEVVTAGPSLSAAERLEIYRQGYRARLIECLEDDYPVLAATLGGHAFEALATGYITRHPSSSPNLNAFGQHMAAFCEEVTLAGFETHGAFLAELARLEWALVLAIHAAPPAPFDLAALQAIAAEAWAGVRLVASESVSLLAFRYPVNAYFQAYRTTGERPSIPDASPTATAVYRRHLTLFRMDLTPAMTSVLAALLGGAPIGVALEKIGVDESDPAALAEAERSVMVWFREWVAAGFFSGLALPGE
jgi:hypothetical protein